VWKTTGVAHRIDFPVVNRDATPQMLNRLSATVSPHRQIPDQDLQPCEFVILAIGGSTLKAGSVTGHQLVSPHRHRCGSEPRFPGNQIQIVAT